MAVVSPGSSLGYADPMSAHRVADVKAHGEWVLQEALGRSNALLEVERARTARLRDNASLALRLAQCRALGGCYFQKLQRWAHYHAWTRFACPNKVQSTRRSIVPETAPLPEVFPEECCSRDFLRRQVLQERQKNKSLKRLNRTLEATLCAMKDSERPAEKHAEDEPQAVDGVAQYSASSDAEAGGPTPRLTSPVPSPLRTALFSEGNGAEEKKNHTPATTPTTTATTSLHERVSHTSECLFEQLRSAAPEAAAVCTLLKDVESQEYWHKANARFRRAHPTFHDGVLKRALQSTFVAREFEMFASILRANGVQFDLDRRTDPASREHHSNTTPAPRLRRTASRHMPNKVAFGVAYTPRATSRPAQRAKSTGTTRRGTTPKKTPAPPSSPGIVPEAKAKAKQEEQAEPHVSVQRVQRSQSASPRKGRGVGGGGGGGGSAVEEVVEEGPVQFVDTDGDLLSFTVQFEGLVYCVNGEARPPSRCIVVSEEEHRVDFPDIAKAVTLPEDMEVYVFPPSLPFPPHGCNPRNEAC